MRIRARILHTTLALTGLLVLALFLGAGAVLAADMASHGGNVTHPALAGFAGDDKAAATAEGEGEGEGEGEAEGEGEGEPPPPAIDTVTLLSPRGNVVALRAATPVSVFFAAKVTLTEDAPAGTVPAVSFVLDGKEHPAVFAGGIWQTTAELPMGTSHKVSARAEVEIPLDSKVADEDDSDVLLEIQESEPLSFAVRFADDLDANGYPDNPFKALAGVGDEWHGLCETDTCSRLVMVAALKSSASPTTVYMPNPANLAQLWTVTVPAGLLLSGERGMLMLAKACDEYSLYAPEEAPSPDTRPGVLVPGAGFYEVHLIVSTDGGKTFFELGSDRLGPLPLAMRWDGIRPTVGNTTALHGREAFVEGDATAGVTVVPGEDGWTRDGIRLLQGPETDGIMYANVSRAGALAPFQTPQPPRLEVVPGGAAGRFGFGIVTVATALTQDFTLTNTGSEPLSGVVTLDDPSGVFAIKQPPEYTLPAGRSTTISLQFIPVVVGDYIATLTFTGGDTGPQTITITGTGTAKAPKMFTAFGCAGGVDGGNGTLSDLLALAAALGLLAFGARRARA